MDRILALLLSLLVMAGTSAIAQSTAFTYQGRLTDNGALANGVYDFRLFTYDSDAGGNQVGQTQTYEDVSVVNGVFVLYPDFGPGVFNGQPRWIEVGVRVGASTGTYTTLSPRQPVLASPVAHTALSLAAGGVGTAQLAAGSVTLDKLAPAVAAGLGGTPSGGLIAAFDANATNLLASGYTRVPSLSSTVGGWEQIPERNTQTNYYKSGYSSLWTGTELLVGGEGMGGFPARFALTRFNPATGLWAPAATNGEPVFTSMGLRYVKLVQGGADIYVVGNTDTLVNTNSTGGIYNLTNGTWRNLPTNGATQIYDDGGAQVAHVFWTGSELLAAGTPVMGDFGAAIYNPVTNSWRVVGTNGYSPVAPDSAIIAWSGTELLVFGESRTNFGGMAGSLYRPDTGVWRPASTNAGPTFSSGLYRKKPLWTGIEWVMLIPSSFAGSPTRFFVFNPAQNTWRASSTNGMPALGDPSPVVPNLFWTGSEVGMIIRSGAAIPFKATVALYAPASDTWRSFTTTEPSIANVMNVTDYTVGVVPVWNTSEAIAYLNTTTDGIFASPKVFRFTPPRTLYYYQKP